LGGDRYGAFSETHLLTFDTASPTDTVRRTVTAALIASDSLLEFAASDKNFGNPTGGVTGLAYSNNVAGS
jgi:hypothetical protein